MDCDGICCNFAKMLSFLDNKSGALIRLQPFNTTFGSKTTFVHTAKWCLRQGDHRRVDAQHACVDMVDQLVRRIAISGKGIGGQADFKSVGFFQSVVQIVKAANRGHRAKRFLVHDPR